MNDLHTTPSKCSHVETPTTPSTLRIKQIDVTTEEGFIQWSRVPELASLELAFHLLCLNESSRRDADGIRMEMDRLGVTVPTVITIDNMCGLSVQSANSSRQNVKLARQRLSQCLDGYFAPRDGQMLHMWRLGGHHYTSGRNLEA